MLEDRPQYFSSGRCWKTGHKSQHLGQRVCSCRPCCPQCLVQESHTAYRTCPPLCVQLHQVKVLTAQAAQAETAAEGLRLVQQGAAPAAAPIAAAGQTEAGEGEASLLARLAAAETDQERLLLLAEVRWSVTETLCCQAMMIEWWVLDRVCSRVDSVPVLSMPICCGTCVSFVPHSQARLI